MENISQFKAKMTPIGSSRYILVPNKVREFEGINDDDIVIVTIQKVTPVEEIR
jgi:bifunctional DNA-binding transcriptional regulator/antitoxin component of YhaV-PrlF toxin-antitoxin module